MFDFFHEKFQKFPKMHLGFQVSKTLGRLIIQTFTTDLLLLLDYGQCTIKKNLKVNRCLKSLD